MRSLNVVALAALASALASCNCGSPGVVAVNGACKATSDCASGLTCKSGKCVASASSADASRPDIAFGDGGEPIVTDGGGFGCHPKTCADLGFDCGPAGDGCGGLLDCGKCTSPKTCGGGGNPSQCGGSQGCVPKSCTDLGIGCGPAGDGCGGTLDCGGCTAPQTCGGAASGQCGGFQGCVPLDCASAGIECGSASDGCGNLLTCGGCKAPMQCGGGGVAGKCGGSFAPDGGAACLPKTCAQQGIACGPAGDGCGGTLDCPSCPFPTLCGGGGTLGVCGGSVCVPETCAMLGLSCGSAGDGCGNTIDCGPCNTPGDTCGGGGVAGTCGHAPACVGKTCTQIGSNCGTESDGCGTSLTCGTCTSPDTCGGGGTAGVCGHPACAPTTCAKLGLGCGTTDDGCGGTLTCGTCTTPDTCGGGGAPGQCGHAQCASKTCAQIGSNCGTESDGCGNPLSCGNCTSPEICGGGGVPGRCGDGVDGGMPPCLNLCQHQVACDASKTTITGRVTAPGHDDTATWGTPDPIYNALVYVPNGSIQPFPAGVSCDQCSAATGSPLVSTNSAYDGTFTLTNVPAGVSFPLVVQLGRWRRQVTVGPFNGCSTVAVGDVRMPRDHTEGDIPLIAVASGAVDSTECVLRKIGIADTEFTSSAGTGRVRLYPAYDTASCTGTPGAVGTPTGGQNACYLTATASELSKYDMIIFSCVGASVTQTSADQQRLVSYANAGGRIFATHFSYVWADAWNTAATWAVGNSDYTDPGPYTATVNQSFAKGSAFAQWLKLVGASTTLGQVPVTYVRDDNCGAVSPTEDWLNIGNTYGTCSSNKTTLHMTWNAPPPGPGVNQCGRVLFSDFHVSNNSVNGATYPGECTQAPMDAQEKVLEFMLFDLASCIVPDVPPPPTCTPTTCAKLGYNCGTAGDGCGKALSCGSCTAPQTCGGGGSPNVCGPSCKPMTCAQLGFKCGSASDGCGGTLSCGTCTAPQTCGGSGTPGSCGQPSCTAKTCTQLGFNCGAAGDGCGGALSCGNCTAPQICGGGGSPNVCGPNCKPFTCTQLGLACGPSGDGCGGSLSCGSCTAPQTCGGGGVAGKCGGPLCVPQTCAKLGYNCGPAGDGCGTLLQCGSCTPPEFCGAVAPGQCGLGNSCTPLSCADQKLSCGPAGDGCDGTLDCGPCTPPETCGGAGVHGACGKPNCTAKTCTDEGINCGPAGDGCGGALDCGDCTAPLTCGGGGTPGVCGQPNCTPTTCQRLGFDCGPAGDGCGGLLDCGTCTPPATCGGAGVSGQCNYGPL